MPRRNDESFSGFAPHESAQPEISSPKAAIRQAANVADRLMVSTSRLRSGNYSTPGLRGTTPAMAGLLDSL
jgi:hypothetical protein